MSGVYSLLIGPFETFGFMRTALVACLALALASGPIGTLLLLRRMSLEGDVLSHAVMPGAALGFLYAGYSFAALSIGGLLTGALVAGSAGVIARLQPKRKEKVGDPHRVVDVTLAAGNIADMSSIREHKLEPTLQHMPDRLPVDARGLHRHVRNSLARQPIRKFQKIVRRRRKAAYLMACFRPCRQSCTGDDGIAVNIETSASPM